MNKIGARALALFAGIIPSGGAWAQVVIDFESLGLTDGDRIGPIGGVTFDGDAAVQGGTPFAFGSPNFGNDTGGAPPFSRLGNVFATSSGGVFDGGSVKTLIVEFLQPVGNLSFSVCDIDSIAPGTIEELTAEVFGEFGGSIAQVVHTAPTTSGMLAGDGDVTLIDFGATSGIWKLVITVTNVGNTLTTTLGWGADQFSFWLDPFAWSYCSCDGAGTPAPCANTGTSGSGCGNATSTAGCTLAATGTSSLGLDTLMLHAGQSTPNQPGLFFQGNNAINGGNGVQFGDGLRCAGGSVVRLEIVTANGAGSASSTVPIAVTGGVSPGDIKRYQWWYRDPTGSPCGTGFNLSNGLEVTWAP